MPGKYEESSDARRQRRNAETLQQKVIWYLPVIGLVVVLILVGILLGVSLESCSRQESPATESTAAQTDAPVTTTPETTVPETTVPETTVPETTVPETTIPDTTVPETTAPPPVLLDPRFDFIEGAVDESWYDDALFIGDSRIVGLRDYARSGNADYFCSVGMSVFNYKTRTESDRDFSSQTLESLLSSHSYGKVFISLGINECGYPIDSLISSYSGLVELVRQYQPNATIVLQGIMTVSKGYAGDRSYFQPKNINAINDRIRQLSDGILTYYIDVNTVFTDGEGYLLTDISGDGCHLSAKYAAVWAQWISYAVGNLGL